MFAHGPLTTFTSAPTDGKLSLCGATTRILGTPNLGSESNRALIKAEGVGV